MLTPVFRVDQNYKNVFFTIHAPYTNISRSDIDVDGDIFTFSSTPYYLRLQLPGEIVQIGRWKGGYQCHTGEFNLKFAKVIPGQDFPNLDKLKSLGEPLNTLDVNSSLFDVLEEDGISIENEEEEIQEGYYAYGFAGKIKRDIYDIGKEFPDILELQSPERVAMNQRHQLRIHYENHKFTIEGYVACLYDDEVIAPYLAAVMSWNSPDFEIETDYTEYEMHVLRTLPIKHYNLSKKDHREVLLTLVDILFAYCYDKRTTFDADSGYSCWTVNKVSSAFTWFCTFDDMRDLLIACYRRALCLPVYRNYKLCNKVKEDVASLLSKGKMFVLKRMIDLYNLFNTSDDGRYVLNHLYVQDYLIYLQKCKEEEFQELSASLLETEVFKDDLDLNLEMLEVVAALVESGEAEIVLEQMTLLFANMAFMPGLNTEIDVVVDDVVDDEDDDEDDGASWVTASSSQSGSDGSFDEASASGENESDEDDPS